jgi:hypothetical protein
MDAEFSMRLTHLQNFQALRRRGGLVTWWEGGRTRPV